MGNFRQPFFWTALPLYKDGQVKFSDSNTLSDFHLYKKGNQSDEEISSMLVNVSDNSGSDADAKKIKGEARKIPGSVSVKIRNCPLYLPDRKYFGDKEDMLVISSEEGMLEQV